MSIFYHISTDLQHSGGTFPSFSTTDENTILVDLLFIFKSF